MRQLIGLALAIAFALGLSACGTPPYDQPVDSWTSDYVSRATFDCAINKDKPRETNGQADKLVPCWNQSFHVTVDGKGQPSIGEFTKVRGSATVEQGNAAEYDAYKKTGADTWVFTVLSRDDIAAYQYDFSYWGNSSTLVAQDRQIYYRIDNGAWQIAGNFGDITTTPGQKMEAVLFFLDPTQPRDLVRTPFNWRDVSKGLYMQHFADN